jgi:hypothetical protein
MFQEKLMHLFLKYCVVFLSVFLGRVLWASAAQPMSQQWCESSESNIPTNIAKPTYLGQR